MSVTDPISDMLTRIRNAVMVRHGSVLVPVSKLKLEITRVLAEEGFIGSHDVVNNNGPKSMIRIQLRYGNGHDPYIRGLKRVSRPGLRMYAAREAVPRNLNGLGVSVVSTSQGLMTGYDARRRGVGGEILCYVW
jgi:small subunit ribosomal protein S8